MKDKDVSERNPREAVEIPDFVIVEETPHLRFTAWQLQQSVIFGIMTILFLVMLAMAVNAVARDIHFPPVATFQYPIAAGTSDNDPSLDISSVLYSGLTTYANLPYVHCLANEDEDVEKYDIAILGGPFDTASHNLLARHA